MTKTASSPTAGNAYTAGLFFGACALYFAAMGDVAAFDAACCTGAIAWLLSAGFMVAARLAR